jgi:hypothetical protein
MRGISVKPQRMRALRRAAVAGGALIAVLALAGCSTGNLTGFDFPSFGLTKKSDGMERNSGRPADQRLGNQ